MSQRVVLVCIAFILALAGGCAPVPALPDCQSVEVICVGLVTDVNGLTDYGLNEQAWLVLQEAREEGVVVDVIESVEVRDYRKNLAYFAGLGYDLVLASGLELSQVAQTLATEYPQVTFVMLGQAPPENDSPPNLAGIVFPQEQAGFWAGVLAAHFSETRIVGAIFAHPEIPSVAAYSQGFASGAADVEIRMVFHDDDDFATSLNNPIWGADQAAILEQAGADVLFAYGGRTAISALEQAKGRVIGVELDWARRYPYFQNQVIASIVFDLSILKEIALAGQVEKPLYEAEYRVVWGDTPVPELLFGDE